MGTQVIFFFTTVPPEKPICVITKAYICALWRYCSNSSVQPNKPLVKMKILRRTGVFREPEDAAPPPASQVVMLPTQGSNPHLLHWQMDSLPLSLQGSSLRLCKERKKVKSLSRVQLFVTLWTVVHQAPPSMGFSRLESWLGCHFLLQGVFPTQGSNPGLPHCRQTIYLLSHQESPKGCVVDSFC